MFESDLIPSFSVSRFPGYDKESETLDAAVLRKYIFGGHVSEYMKSLEESDNDSFQKQFSGSCSITSNLYFFLSLFYYNER